VADAQAFCIWLGEKIDVIVRLPEVYEWEFAAKGGIKSKGYEYSGSNNLDEVGWYDDNSGSSKIFHLNKNL
jgi:formylglycine-generating enzyme required for sulfatase activity